ncbi:MAG: ribosome maturation factor RimP [Armatimonadetes bacterium]|nr:ribosome maturation factor RimP [Armatimonadota bacterium]
MNRKELVQQVEEMARPVAARMGLEVVDVQLLGEIHRPLLRVLMDRPEGGISVEECARVNEALSRQLDLYDLFATSYTLEVSSPGLDRPLRTDADFRRFAGRRAEITTYAPIDGQRRFRGMLLGVLGDAVVVQIDERQVHVPKGEIAQARLAVEMDDLRADFGRK